MKIKIIKLDINDFIDAPHLVFNLSHKKNTVVEVSRPTSKVLILRQEALLDIINNPEKYSELTM